jgi:ribosome recycling factor
VDWAPRPRPRSQPWTALVGEIAAIQKSDLEGIPSATATCRIYTAAHEGAGAPVKVVKKMVEEGRVAVRNVRRDGNEELKKLQKDKKISEDAEKKSQAEVQKLTDKHIAQMDELLSKKEAEIMEV